MNRLLVLALLALLGLFWAMPAHAITPQEAMQACADYDANVYSTGTVSCMDMGNNTPGTLCSGGGPAAAGVGYVCGLRSGGGSVNWQYSFDFSSCVAPMEYDKSSHQCADLGERCRAKNSVVPDTSTFAGAFGTCVDGCMIGEREPDTAGKVDVYSTSIHFGKVGFTGETCTGSSPMPNFDAGKTCVPASGGGMTVCVTPDGRHCYSTKATVVTLGSDAVCWRPGETGTKSQGPVVQTRGPGTNPPTPPAPPPGETQTPGPGNPTTTTTTTPTGTTVNTTTINSTNNNGTDGPNQDSSGDGDGEGEETGKGSVSGGTECDSPPVVTGGDPVLAAVVQQTWATRCAVKEGDSVTTTGDIRDCSAAFTVEGEEGSALVLQVQAERAALCPGEQGEGTDGRTGEGPNDGAIWQVGTGSSLLSGLDASGWLSSSCVPIPTFDFGAFGSYSPEIPYWCTLLQYLGAFVMFAASLTALMILTL